MGDTTFQGAVRSENGFESITKNATTGAVTTNSTFGNNVSVGGTLAVTGTAAVTGVTTLTGNTLGTEAGAGITGGTGTVYKSSVERVGGIIRTTIMIDLTGLECPTTIGDIIGVNGSTDAAHLGQITAAVNGTILAGRMTCYEAPTTGDPDINVYAADEATGIENGAIGDLTETLLVNAGDATLGSIVTFTAVPAADQYLYLTAGTVTEGTYDAGKLLIELFGY